MKNEKYHCPKCKLLFDSLNHLPRILPSCLHSICSYCVNEQLHKDEKNIICPIDNTVYEKIENINFFKENQNLIEEIQEKLNMPTNHNYEISNEEIFFDKSGIIMNSDKFSDTSNSLNLNTSIISSAHCYYKKSKEIRSNLLSNNNSQICAKHSLPLNIICIDEKEKICSQCALNNEHVNHQIMTEIEFMNNIDNLIDLFHEVDNNQIKYLNFNEINTKLILDKIGTKINSLIQMINETKNDIINRIKIQCEKIENYLDKRKNEILDKYQSTNFDISTLRQSTLNWMQLVTNKLDQLNDIVNPPTECIKLLNGDIDKNIFNLIRSGKQLNGRYNFVQETIKIIGKLENFDKTGIDIKYNDFIVDKIFFTEKEKIKDDDEDININLNIEETKKEIEENNNIKSSLFEIKENKELINSLHLTQYNFEFLDNNKLFKSENEEKIVNPEEINENNNIINNNENVLKNNKEQEKEKNNKEEEKESEILLNLNIDEIKKESANDELNNNNKNLSDNINDKSKIDPNDKNNISKIIEDLSFNDDTLLINSLLLNQNDTVYHKKVKNDYPLELKNPNRKKEKEKEKQKDITLNNNINNNIEEKPKSITTKKIDLSELNKNNNKLMENSNKKANNKNTKNNFSSKNSFYANDIARSLDINNNNDLDNNINNNKIPDTNPINVNVINNNKNEIVINFTKKISGTKKNKPICSNYMKSEKKSIFGKARNNMESSPCLVSRSPGRMNCGSKLAGFYSFVPLDKINQKQIELNQYKNTHKTLISSKDFSDNKNKIISDKNFFKCSKNYEDDNDINLEYSSNKNIRRNTLVTTKVNKKIKSKNEISTKIIKKINNSKLTQSTDNLSSVYRGKEKYNTINKPNNNKDNLNNIKDINQNINISINNNINQFESKPKKDLQEFISNQLKTPNPNFSRINMSGYGIQYLCSFLHKNPNTKFKEIKLLGCNLNDDDLFMLTRTLLDHEIEVFILNLSSNKITDDSASNILDILKECKALKGLSLYNNLISSLLKDKLVDYAKLGRENFEMVQLYI